MTGPSVQITTASSDDGGRVLFDFVDSGPGWSTWVKRDRWSIGSPKYQGEPDSYGGQWSTREITITLVIQGPEQAALRQQAALARVLLRPRGLFLRYQHSSATTPTWWPLLQAQPGELDFTDVTSDDTAPDRWRIDVTLPAEALGLQERQWLLGTATEAVTIGNDPSAAGGVMVDLPPLRGDAPAPLRIDVVPSIAWDGYRPLMSVAALDEQPPVDGVAPAGGYPTTPILWRATQLAAGVDVTGTNAGPAWIGGARRRVTFATETGMATRVHGPVPKVPPLGRYMVFARIGRSDTSTAFELRLGQRYGVGSGTAVWGATVRHDRGTTATSDGAIAWVPLGSFTFPLGADPQRDDPSAVSTPEVVLQMARVAGGGTADVDALLLVPEEIATTRQTTSLGAFFSGFGINPARSGVWSGETSTWAGYDITADGLQLAQGVAPQHEGAYPVAVPGCRNVLHLLQQTFAGRPFFGDNPSGDQLAATTAVKISYQPRVLWIGGDA